MPYNTSRPEGSYTSRSVRYSQFYNRSRRSQAKTDSKNAYLLEKSGFVEHAQAGSYTLLPIGLRVVKKIEQIVREEMDAIGASELLMPSLQNKQLWEKSGRWTSMAEIIYFDAEKENCFAPTHEELLTSILASTIKSYQDLPVLLYQIQTKFRRELRAKSGLLRGREFIMKDLYSFHPDEKNHNLFYEQAAGAYHKVFKRLGLESYRVKASGGAFSKEFSDEFQVLCETGEDEILYDSKKKTGYNKEVENQINSNEKKKLERSNSIEVGNIFHLGSKYAKDFGLKYLDASGKNHLVVMGSYGIGITRLLGTLAELFNDENGLIWPKSVAPFQVYLIDLTDSKIGQKLATDMEKAGIEVLFDDRDEAPGVKMVEADMLGLPHRVLYSHKTAQEGKVEIKDRKSGKIKLVEIGQLAKNLL